MGTKEVLDPFANVHALASECGEKWPSFSKSVDKTNEVKAILATVFKGKERLLDANASLVLCGSFARNEMVPDSDCDWSLLIDGGVSTKHTDMVLGVQKAMEEGKTLGLKAPGNSGVFGNMCISHDLVHRIGGSADTNGNLTRRLLMLLESKPINLSPANRSETVWEGVVSSILQRYFEEDVHFSVKGERRVPRFLFNDLTRYWRTICVDYAAKHWDQGEAKWALRNAKLRFSRKLLYASGMAFCFACQLNPPKPVSEMPLFEISGELSTKDYVNLGKEFARTPPLEYLAAFIRAFVIDDQRRKLISSKIFGSYNEWLKILGDDASREHLTSLSHDDAREDELFDREIRVLSKEFASGLKLLFFNRDEDPTDAIVDLSIEYVGF